MLSSYEYNQLRNVTGPLDYMQIRNRSSIVNTEAYNKVVALEYKQSKKRKLKLLI